MKKTTVAALLVASIGVSQTVNAGIPVTVVADAPGQIAQIQNFTQMLKDYAVLTSQLETAQMELDRISGSRGLAGVIDSMYDIAVSVDPDAVLSSAGINSATDHGLTGDVAGLYDTGNQNSATWLGQSQKSLEQAQDRFGDLMGLVAEVNNSPDQKDILDLQARIGAEEVILQNETAKLNMLQSQAQANQAMQNQRIQQMAVESAGQLRTVSW